MTLLTTEIHVHEDRSFVIFAADRQISRGGRPAGSARKVFRAQGGKVGIGFFGLAELDTEGSHESVSAVIEGFLNKAPAGAGPQSVAELLLAKLIQVVPYADAMKEPMGFHVSGIASDGMPEFWYVRNIDDQGLPTGNGFELREDFRRRDLAELPQGKYVIYRNGDIQAHTAVWSSVDQSLGSLLGSPSFRGLTTPEDHESWVRTKMELVAAFYERFAMEKLIGNPIDSFVISQTD